MPDIEWTCTSCSLPPLSDSFFAEDSCDESLNKTLESDVSQPGRLQRRSDLQDAAKQSSIEHEQTTPDNAKLDSLREHFNKDLLIGHLNINSIQNKFEELTATIKTIGAHVMFNSETKIDSSYPNAQFSIPGYSLYRNDRKKGGRGIMALVSSSLTKKRLNPLRSTRHWN